MKKILLSSFVLSGILFANQLSYIPLNKSNLSNENGGNKLAIESYSDGIGIYLSGSGDKKFPAMNELVFKFGEEAKKNGKTLKEYVLEKGNNKEKELAALLGNSYEPSFVIGDSCDDNDPNTIFDKYIDTAGTCQGGPAFTIGAPCNDNDINTLYDKYTDIIGTCVGKTWYDSPLPVLTSVYTNFSYNNTTKTWTATEQFGNIFFDFSQNNGLKKIEFYQTENSQSGMSLYISAKPSNPNFGNACAYASIDNETWLNAYNQNYILTVDYDNRKYWLQTKTNYTNDFKGTKNNFHSKWTPSNLSLFIQDCTSSGTGSFRIISVESVNP